MRGGLVYCGAKNYGYSFPKNGDVYGEQRPSKPSEFITEHGSLSYEIGVQFDANVKRNQTWRFIVAYEPDDTYSVYLVKLYGMAKIGKTGKLSEKIVELHGIYADTLQETIKREYDLAIKKYNQGFIDL